MISSYLYLNDLRFHYLRWNTPGEGRPIVLLHGLASNARIWEMVAPYLIEGGLAPLAPDLRGHGLTDKPDGDYGFDTYARDLAAFLNAFELEKPLLVGHSWGAMLVLDYAARFSFGPRAPGGIVLVDGGTTQMSDFPGATWEQMRDRLTPPRLAGTLLENFLTRLSSPNSRWQPDDQATQIILANFEVDEDERIYPHLSFEHHMQIVRAMWEFQTYQRFERVRCLALIIPARPSSPLSPPEQEYLAFKERGIAQAQEKILNVQVRWMENAIHDIPLQYPAELGKWIAGFVDAIP